MWKPKHSPKLKRPWFGGSRLLCDVGGSPALRHAFQGTLVGLDATPGPGLLAVRVQASGLGDLEVREWKDVGQERNSKEMGMLSRYPVYSALPESFCVDHKHGKWRMAG